MAGGLWSMSALCLRYLGLFAGVQLQQPGIQPEGMGDDDVASDS